MLKTDDIHTEMPEDTLRNAADLMNERGKLYGDIRQNFSRIAKIASTIIGRDVSRYEIAVVLLSVKLGRIPEDPGYGDSYDDGINYLAFMKMFREEMR